MLPVKIINKSHHALPTYQTSGAAGMDLCAFIPEIFTLQPMERRLIPTGLFIELPTGYEAQVRPRSGMAIKKGITMINTPGTIDSDYRGELLVPIINLSGQEQTIEDGERIAQMVIAKHETVAWQLVEQIEDTSRGSGGFGHTGTK